MKVAILGFGRQGRSAARFYAAGGDEVTVCDQVEALEAVPAGVSLQLGARHLENLDRFDLLVRTPILQPDKITAANPSSPRILDKVTTATNEFFKRVTTPIIAVTGTKGKGTTCLLSAALLRQAGLKVCLVGNLGVPPLDVLVEAEAADVVVFEIASFQTLDLARSPQVGVCLNMSPEHLDWHRDYDDYLNCKAQLFANQRADDKAIFAAGDSDAERVASVSRGQILSYGGHDSRTYVHIKDKTIYAAGQAVADIADIKLLGEHNHQNVCAAVAACYDFLPSGRAPDIIPAALRVCEGFPSRLEPIRELEGVLYINDSYASAPPASIAALKAVSASKVLIAGGHDKGADMEPFVDKILTSDVKHVIVIGQTGEEIARLLRRKRPDFSIQEDCRTMREIVEAAAARAVSGDVVLLSPASASFGMFKDYNDRAEQFKRAVASLS